MLKPYPEEIHQIAFIHGHCGFRKSGKSRLYSVSSLIFDHRGPKQAIDSLIRYTGFTARENYISGISKEKLASAPPLPEVESRLKDFLKDQDFVVTLDMYDDIDEIVRITGCLRRIDLGFAAEFFLPQLNAFSYKGLWEFLYKKKRQKAGFTSREIVELSVELVKRICSVELNDRLNGQAGALRYYLEASRTLFGRFFTFLTRHASRFFGELFDPCSTPDSPVWKIFLEKGELCEKKPAKKVSYTKISPETIEHLFAGLAQSGKRYSRRPLQIEYAGHIAAALNDSAVAALEAGTGTGKTQGYLLPVMEFLYRNPEARVAISTYTKNLQEQIFHQELVFTMDIFKHYQDIPVALLKGKSCYICAEKLDHLLEDGWEGRKLLGWLYFVNLVFHFRQADLESVGERIKKYLNEGNFIRQIIREVSARGGCTPVHRQCPAQILTAEAAKARLVITNHHKLALLDQDTILANLFRNYIIDEANHFESAVRGALGIEINSWEVVDFLNYLDLTARRLAQKKTGGIAGDIQEAQTSIDEMKTEIHSFYQALSAIRPYGDPGAAYSIEYNHPNFRDGHIENHLQAMAIRLHGIVQGFSFVKDPEVCRSVRLQSRTVERIKNALHQLSEFVESFRMIRKSVERREYSTAFRYFNRHWSIVAQSVEVSDIIRDAFYKNKDCIVYTAATLTRNQRFDTFLEITGMKPMADEKTAKIFRFETIPSPYPEAEIIVPDNAVSGKYTHKKIWLKTIADIIPEFIEKNKGRTLVLFSSYTDLNSVVAQIQDRLSDSAYPILIQQQGASTVNLCEEFRAIKESVLFGVDTFWYGVDFKGDTLTQVIITRIPYPSPFDPIQTARKKILPPDQYWKRYLYDTEIKLKQGIGRLIRSETDRGRVIILDARHSPKTRTPSHQRD